MALFRKHFNLPFFSCLLLAFIGGFIELYAVRCHGIYPAMQTGNLITLFINLSDGKYALALASFAVILFFLLGCFLGEGLRLFLGKRKHIYKPLAILIEALLLLPLLFIKIDIEQLQQTGVPTYQDILADGFLALFGAFQLCTFKDVNAHFFASTMMTTILKNIASYTLLAIKEKDSERLLTVLEFVLILTSFILGFLTFYLVYSHAKENRDVLLQYLILFIQGLLIFVLFPLAIVESHKEKEETIRHS